MRVRSCPTALAVLLAVASSASAVSLPVIIEKAGTVASESIQLPALDRNHQYSILYSLSSLRHITAGARVSIEVRQGSDVLASKTLHMGDPDFYTQFRVPRDGAAEVRIRNSGAAGGYRLQVNRWPLSDTVRAAPVHRWQDAMAVQDPCKDRDRI